MQCLELSINTLVCGTHTGSPSVLRAQQDAGLAPSSRAALQPHRVGCNTSSNSTVHTTPCALQQGNESAVPGGPAPILCARQLQGTVKASNFEYSPSLMNSFLESHSSAQNSIQGKTDIVKLQTGRSYGDGSDVLNSVASQEVQRSFPFLNQAHIRFLPSWLKTKDR